MYASLALLKHIRTAVRTLSTSYTHRIKMESNIMCSQEILSNLIAKNASHKDEVILGYLKNLDYPPVEDFNKGLEWFNVSEPLSFCKHLKGKVVVLDFFTYCCINCMHILPDLKEIESEFSVQDGLVVIGVHSAKFENEKLSKNILAAVQRYNISHPVVNDNTSDMWRKCEVQCWPTLLLLGPNANPIVMIMGEGHKEELRLYIKNALAYYKSKNEISDHKLPIKSAFHLLPELKGPLLFPGKITSFTDDDKNELLAVSDTGNHRILILNTHGIIIYQIGGSKVGFKDGTFKRAEFNSPQGLVFQNKDVLFVADTENHAIRRIHFKTGIVQTIVGNGKQGSDNIGGKTGKLQEISSPWDLCIYNFKEANGVPKQILFIAMAGLHQIWAYFMDDVNWWKSKTYYRGACAAIAGSGKEENRNNAYPHAAAFAQPSGIALCHTNKEMYIADSESSTVRRLSLLDGKVTPVVGGDKNPNNLFAFGDKDGLQHHAKLQHLLGLALSQTENELYVVDTYNHKLKKVDVHKDEIKTVCGPKGGMFNEPGGLCILENRLYIADTNNHCIKVLKLDSPSSVASIKRLELKLKNDLETSNINKSKFKILQSNVAKVHKDGGKLILQIAVSLADDLKLTADAPQEWFVDLPNLIWSSVPASGTNINCVDVVVSIPKTTDTQDSIVDVIFNLSTCTATSCYPKNFIVRQVLQYSDIASRRVNKSFNVVLGLENTELFVSNL